MKIHKRFWFRSSQKSLCGLELTDLYITTKWKLVDCKNCLKRREKWK